MTNLTQSAFAAHLGIARSYVTQLKKEGRLVMSEDGKLVDLEASQARIAETADPGKAAVAERHAQARGAAVELSTAAVHMPETAKTEPPAVANTAADTADENEPEPQTPDYQKAKARKAAADASMAEMELAERAGHLFRAAEVLEVIADAATTFRVSLDARRAMMVSQLAVLSDERAVREFLEDQDEALLADLSARFSDIGKKP